MNKPLIILLLFIQVISLPAQDIKLSNGVEVEFSFEKKPLFTSVSGDATGVLMEQKFGSLENILTLIVPLSQIDISEFDQINDYSYNLKLLNFDKDKRKSSQKELLDFISNEVGFKWSFESRKVKEWQMRVVN